mgnify:CR=1 FL=1
MPMRDHRTMRMSLATSATGGRTSRTSQKGIMLIEGLIALVLFAIGILAFIGLQAVSIKSSADAKYRADAAFMADAVIGLVSGDIPNAAQYAHNANGGQIADDCKPTSSPSINPNVTDWVGTVAKMLPAAEADRHQIIVDTATREVTVRICWQAPQDARPSNYIVKAVVQ